VLRTRADPADDLVLAVVIRQDANRLAHESIGGLDGVAERVREQLQNSPDIAKDPPPQVGFQPNIDGGMTLEVRYWLDYRKHDPLEVQAAVGRQVYQAIQPTKQAASPN